MKMIYLVKHTKRNFFGKRFFKILSILLLIFAFVFVFSVSNFVRSSAYELLSPFLEAGNSFYGNLSKISHFFSDKNEIIKENIKLFEEIEDLRIKIADYESIKHENQKLREELKIKPAGDFVSVFIIARPPQIPLDSLLINGGVADNIEDNNLVLAGERTLIGRVVEVNKNKAIVALNSFARMVSYGFVARTKEPLEICGMGGGSMEAKVPIDFDIVVGDKIMVTGSSDYIAAVVGMVEEDSSSGLKKVLMSLPVDVSKVSVVFIESYLHD